MRKAAIGALILVSLAFVWWGCESSDDNNNNPPVTGTISGQVIFHGQWPADGTVQLSLFENWNITTCSWCALPAGGPPSYYTPANLFQDPNPDNGDGPDTLEYTLSGITLGTYSAVAVGWRAPTVSDLICDELTIGLFGANPHSSDSIPEAVTFTSADHELTVYVEAYFDVPAPADCDTTGTISGVVRVPGTWPPEGLLVLSSTFPFTPWIAPTGQPTAYFPLLTSNDTTFSLTPRLGSYYLSLWTNVAPPAQPQYYGAYGVSSAAGDARPDMVLINSLDPEAANLLVRGSAPAPHWISGSVNFTGTRPAEGLLVLFSTFPYSPEHPPTGAPSGYYPIVSPTETLYAMTGLPVNTYYVSLWNNVAPPATPTFYGAYGYTSGSDTDPDPVLLDEATHWGSNGINIAGHP